MGSCLGRALDSRLPATSLLQVFCKTAPLPLALDPGQFFPVTVIAWLFQKMLDVTQGYFPSGKILKGEVEPSFFIRFQRVMADPIFLLIRRCSFSSLHYLLPHLEFIFIWFNRVRLVTF